MPKTGDPASVLDVGRLFAFPIKFEPAVPDDSQAKVFTAECQVSAHFRSLDILYAVWFAAFF
jgi:hypothetical protein